MLRTIICLTYVAVSMIFLIPFGMIRLFIRLLGFRRLSSSVMRYIEQGWGRIMVALVGCTVTVSGQENIPHKGGVCFVSNHGSIFDIAVLLAYSCRHIAFIAKKELLWVPLVNVWIIFVGGLFIDRKNPRKALKTFNKGIARLKSGGTMIIFPEGHRSRGQGLLPFHPGSLKLATQSEVAIVPVALTGTYDIFEKYGRANPGPVGVTFCKPINTADISAADRKQALSDQIYEVIKAALEKTAEN